MELPFFTTAASSSAANKGEALRWLAIAEKLLAGRDLVGSKSFATRAREADRTLLYADQIIAVADTLLAGDKRINNNQPDWYSILQVSGNQTRDSELIAGQYRKLTFLLNPQKNQLPYADQAFNLVLNAWSVLSNPSSKSLYDSEFLPHLAMNSRSSGYNNPVFTGVTREQVSYQPFEINFQVMPPQHQQQQQGIVREGVSQPHGISREQLSQQFPPHSATVEQVTHPLPQLHLSREQFQQPRPQPQRQQQPQLLPQSYPQSHLQAQPQPRPQPQQQQRKENWMGSNVTQTFASRTAGANNLNNDNGSRGGNNNNVSENVEDGEVREENRMKGSSDDQNLNFWTACPYCYYMYEYPNVYAECTLRCQNKKCRKAFQGVVIPSPPPTLEGKAAYFCCWGMMPMGISMTILERHRGIGGNWTPFSPMFTCPKGAGNCGETNNVNFVGGWNANNHVQGSRSGTMGVRKTSSPRVFVDGDDVFLEYSDSGGESDTEWQRDEGKKKMKVGKRKGATTPSRNVRKALVDQGSVNGGGMENVPDGFVLRDGAGVPTMSVTEPVNKGPANSSMKGVSESSKKGTTPNSRRQSARGPKDFGNLDLNVEFSNEAEEPVRRVSQANGPGRGDEDIIEGGGFFEGLDEFLNSLPIMS